MAGTVARCKACGKDKYDEETRGMRERGGICESCGNHTARIAMPSAAKKSTSSVWDDIFDSMINTPKMCSKEIDNSSGDYTSFGTVQLTAPIPQKGSNAATLEVLAGNINRHEILKMQYRRNLSRLTHRELLEYTVALMDGQEVYESEPTLVASKKIVDMTIENRL